MGDIPAFDDFEEKRPVKPRPGDDIGVHIHRDVRRCERESCVANIMDFTPKDKARLKAELDKFSKSMQSHANVDLPVEANDKEEPVSQDFSSSPSMISLCHKLHHLPEEDKQILKQYDDYARLYNELAGSDTLVRAAAMQRLNEGKNLAKEHGLETPWWEQLWYLCFPFMHFFCAFSFQSMMLHIATHYYINYMQLGDTDEEGQLYDVVGDWVAKISGDRKKLEGSVRQGDVDIDLRVLDASGAVPALMFGLSLLVALKNKRFSIGLWNKTFIVASAMAILKGVFDAVTIIPDSIGWKECQERLKKEGIDHLKNLNTNFVTDFWGSFTELLTLEVSGANGKHVRYCADMMVSGHTYFAAIFALSAYKQIKIAVKNSERSIVVRLVVLCLCFLCIFTEIALVAAQRFHYTVDMLAALVLVVLLFDSTYVEQLASDWSEGFFFRDPEHFLPKSCVLYRLYRWSGQNKKEWRNFFRGNEDQPRIAPSQAVSLLNMRAINNGYPPWWDGIRGNQKSGDIEHSHQDTMVGETAPFLPSSSN